LAKVGENHPLYEVLNVMISTAERNQSTAELERVTGVLNAVADGKNGGGS
jgi:hypothetical protein